MNLRALSGTLALTLAATQLGGCVAAALVPLAASGAVAKRSVDIDKERAGKKKVRPIVTVGKGTATPPQIAPLPTAVEPVLPKAAPSVPLEEASLSPPIPPSLAELDTVETLAEDDGFEALARFVITASGTEAGKPRQSALIDQQSLVSLPRMQTCSGERGALVIDLDPGEKPFDPADPPSPAPGLAEHLRKIRGTGTAVVWIATLPESASGDIGTILKATGLDPLGIDKTLLLRRGETRKQQALLRASQDWCVLAIAGDRKGDFDEVFDYLRNPNGPVALALEQHVGAGWFLVPPPIR